MTQMARLAGVLGNGGHRPVFEVFAGNMSGWVAGRPLLASKATGLNGIRGNIARFYPQPILSSTGATPPVVSVYIEGQWTFLSIAISRGIEQLARLSSLYATSRLVTLLRLAGSATKPAADANPVTLREANALAALRRHGLAPQP